MTEENVCQYETFLNNVDGQPKAYGRIVLHAKDVAQPTNNFGSVLDPSQLRIKTFGGGLYNNESAASLTNRAMEFMLSRYGLDFSKGVYNEIIGSFSLPQGTMYPYAVGDNSTYRLVFDSQNLKRGQTNDWIVFEAGYIVLMMGSGTFPDSTETYGQSFILPYIEYNYLDTKHQDKWLDTQSESREIVVVRGDWPSMPIVDSQGLTGQFIKATVIDNHGNEGFLSNQVTLTKIGENIVQRTRTFLTFPETIVYQ